MSMIVDYDKGYEDCIYEEEEGVFALYFPYGEEIEDFAPYFDSFQSGRYNQ